MRKVRLSAIHLLILAACVRTVQPAHAAGAGRCDWAPRSVAVAVIAAPATDESRVADWIVARILKLAADSGPVVEISPQEAAAATGIDMTSVDPEQVAQHVRERLRELSRRPFVQRPAPARAAAAPAPASPCPAAHPAPDPASDPAATWAPAETTGGVPETRN